MQSWKTTIIKTVERSKDTRTHTHTHTHTRARAHTHTHAHARGRAHTHAHTHVMFLCELINDAGNKLWGVPHLFSFNSSANLYHGCITQVSSLTKTTLYAIARHNILALLSKYHCLPFNNWIILLSKQQTLNWIYQSDSILDNNLKQYVSIK